MNLIEQITEDVIKIPLTGTDKPGILLELIQVLKDAGKIREVGSVLKAVQAREDLNSTGLEKGIAVPHAKTTQVDDLMIAIGIAPDGIDFNSADGEPSRIFFLLLAPPDKSGPHIEALAEIARIAGSPSFLKLLVQASSPAEIMELFKGD